MPNELDGIPLTREEHRVWKAVFDRTGDGGQATNAVKELRRSRRHSARPKR